MIIFTLGTIILNISNNISNNFFVNIEYYNRVFNIHIMKINYVYLILSKHN